jgi:hypothetical protein
MLDIRDDGRTRTTMVAGKSAALSILSFNHFAKVLCLFFSITTLASANVAVAAVPPLTTVAFAGLAYAGDFSNIDTRFKYSKRYERSLLATGADVNARIRQLLSRGPYPFDLNVSDSMESKGDEVLVTALTVTGETVSQEAFGPVHKLFVQIRAEALIFDFVSKKIRRTYPLSFAYLDVLNHSPSDIEIDERIIKAYEGAQGRRGILERYADALRTATLPHNGDLFLQITKISIAPEAAPAVRPELAAVAGASESWVADHFSEALNSQAGVALFPYSPGAAIGGTMQMRLANTDYNLQFPNPDWEITVNLNSVKKVMYAQNAAGTSYVYGSYATIKVIRHGAIQPILDAEFKNGEVKEVPASQTYVDDLPAYNDSIRGLFDKLAQVLGGQDLPWLKTAAVTSDIGKQITATRGLLQKCK